MEKKFIIRLALVGFLFMAMFGGDAAEKFTDCYDACYFDCFLNMKKLIPYVPKKILPCALKCLKKCLFHPNSQNDIVFNAPAAPPVAHGEGQFNKFEYCDIGCAVVSCADYLDDAVKMEGCVGECSEGVCKAMD